MPRSDKMTKALDDIEKNQLERLAQGENVCSSDRPSDRARTRLKKNGLIKFDRMKWRWSITPAGRALLDKEGK